ncbi:hypothetical protein EIP91_005617 [Steccherinum ochraceum]|uniref:Protein SQS1 n=1 Tax=Steccherinum ochraceum TaxID=92696 RepID=A0A4R0R9L0_9APHY|nr:hypothetical protein EIP91_005617 [Steccherinum ochraceum]
MDMIEQPIQVWAEGSLNGTPNRFNSPRGRGRGGSGYASPRSGFSTPGRGTYTPRGRGRGVLPLYPALEEIPGVGRGNPSFSPRGRRGGRGGKELASKLRGGAPLSKVLYEDRPYLRPIKFVRSVLTATLFTEEEELIRSIQEPTTENEASHVPTADTVAQIFSGEAEREAEEEDQFDEGLEEIDFSDIGRIQREVDAAAARVEAGPQTKKGHSGDQFTGFYVDTTPAQTVGSSSSALEHTARALGDEAEDEEVIVYVAPHPRAGPVTPPPKDSTPDFTSSVSILTGLVHSSLTVKEAAASADLNVDASAAPGAGTSHADDMQDRIDVDGSQSVDVATELIMRETATAIETAIGESSAEVVYFPDPESLPLPPSSFISSGTIEKTILQAEAAVAHEMDARDTLRAGDTTLEGDVVGLPLASAKATSSALEISDLKTTVPSPPAFESISFSFADTPTKRQTRRLHPVKARSLVPKRRGARRKSLRSFGALMSEEYEAGGREQDPRRHEQRRGDSDVDWGDESDEGEVLTVLKDTEVDQISDGVGSMDLDGDLDVNAMRNFVHSMSAEGSRQVTMDDLADIEKMRQEDESEDAGDDDDDGEGSEEDEEIDSEEDEEVEAVLRAEERVLTGDGTAADGPDASDDESDEEEEDDDDEGETPRRNFQARLEKMRSKVKGKQKARALQDDQDDSEDDEDFDMQLDATWADNDEAYLAHIQDMLDGNEEILSGGDRKMRNKLFKAIQDGDLDIDDYEEMMGKPAKRNKGKHKDLPPELQAQWEKDREKKAENKRKRALARLEAAADPLAKRKGGKKGMKDMLRVARMDPEIEIPHRVVNLITVEREIRRFLENIGGPNSMVLPPANKSTRKRVHELATAFSLKSQSKGHGNARYTTLVKTTMSGIKINEKKVKRILREVDRNWDAPERRGGGGATSLGKHREGEEVGKSAPKIGESNVGFKMLAAMGWSEGDRIGLSGGLDAPLVAVMKKTKLGLGATL